MPATTIHFVRHGKVENPGHLLYERLPGFHLSDVGVRMAQATAHYIAVSPQLNTVSAVYSSPLERTRETAGEILESLNSVRGLRGEEPLELQTDERLIEARNEFRGKRIGFGEGALWKNGNWKLVRNLWKPSWGESYQSIAHRMQTSPWRKWRNIPANRSWWSATNRRFGATGTCWKRGTPNTTCCCATPRSLLSPPSLTIAIPGK